ncbi:exodeoxyribonuclease VII large subunit [Thalassospira sp. MCCC 1A02491]|uniref:exodeoxyribonuclease VII large subunit n=1 Tax=Thalassospira sp. MCCC 1A02491 TaxID=1769751 RepID=UPI0007AD6E4B|nr:exodeoxyribonuclease VII large subunit [Thalassospira sp. MCCC 1A02491]KZB69392.1 exodeoxyribonuclease VII large subunit [Thalassospira sp. MCCC 1A02491]
MTQDLFDPYAPVPETPVKSGNAPEFSVSDLSNALKRTVEDAFSFVRVRGEISGFKQASSGHMYLALKDDKAVLDGVCWRGQAAKLGLVPEDGMEVIVTGRLTTFPGRSKYQIVIESMEVAGEGALLKLLEERKKKLAAEGLFDPDRKKPIPFLPDVIGIVTSPTGAVIRDIMHRLRDRFPRRVLLWPVLVQGQGAAEQVAEAVRGFNDLLPYGQIPRPDVLIVARGGGSLEDLWCFNEEIVARAVADSDIPVISAVGHETDTTLIDFVSDLRAPTPTGAAEKAVPVRMDLIGQVEEDGLRLAQAVRRLGLEKKTALESLARGLGDPKRMLEERAQTLDNWADRLPRAAVNLTQQARARLNEASARLVSPREQLSEKRGRLENAALRLDGAMKSALQMQQARLDRAAAGLRPGDAKRDVVRAEKQIADLGARMQAAVGNIVKREAEGLARYDRLLESYSYRNVLKRGFAVVRDGAGNLVGKSGDLVTGQSYDLEMGDGITRVTAGEGTATSGPEGAKPSERSQPSEPTEPAQRKDDSANIAVETAGATVAPKPAKPKPAKKKNPRPQEDDRQGSLL